MTRAQQEAQAGRLEWMTRAIPVGTRIFFLESGQNGKRVRLFYAPEANRIEEITSPAAALTRIRMTRDNAWMSFGGAGYSAGQEAVEALAFALHGDVKSLECRSV